MGVLKHAAACRSMPQRAKIFTWRTFFFIPRRNSEPFVAQISQNGSSVVNYWVSAWRRQGYFVACQFLSILIFSIAVFFVRRPRSACHVERTFSLMGHIQTKDRLHMGNDTLRHLAMMYVNKPTTDDPDGESD